MPPFEQDAHFDEDSASGADPVPSGPLARSDEQVAADELGWLAFRYIADEMTAQESDLFEQRLAIDQAAREAVANEVQISQGLAEALAADVFEDALFEDLLKGLSPPSRAISRLLSSASAQPGSIGRTDNSVRRSGNEQCSGEKYRGGQAFPAFDSHVTHSPRRRYGLRVAAWAGAGIAVCLAWLLVSRFMPDRFMPGIVPGRVAQPYDVAGSGISAGRFNPDRNLASIWATAELPGVPREAGQPEESVDESSDVESAGVETGGIEAASIRVPGWLIAAVTAESRDNPEQPQDELQKN